MKAKRTSSASTRGVRESRDPRAVQQESQSPAGSASLTLRPAVPSGPRPAGRAARLPPRRAQDPPAQVPVGPAHSAAAAGYAPPRGRGIQAIPDDVPLACWLPIELGLTPHGLRHSHKTWMAEDGIPEIPAEQRLGHPSARDARPVRPRLGPDARRAQGRPSGPLGRVPARPCRHRPALAGPTARRAAGTTPRHNPETSPADGTTTDTAAALGRV